MSSLTMEAVVAEFYSDPLGFVYFNYPWGEEGTPLEKHDGPDKWQAEVLSSISDGVLTTNEAIQIAISSGHGIGKGALVAWIVLWFMSTRPHPQIVVTANTKPQLETKTWRELSKWHKLARNRAWFEWTATKFYYKKHPETWFAAAIPWSADNSEAFAGTHEEHVLVVYDEASAIDDVIWEVTEGAMTTPGAIWLSCGNPTRNTGRFRECFGKFRHRWQRWQIDSRTAKMADNLQISKWVKDYGEDSDFVRVRVRGVFPRAGDTQLIPSDLVKQAKTRKYAPHSYAHAPKILSVDVARFGDDRSVMLRRQGLVVSNMQKFRGLDTMNLASRVANEILEWEPDAVFVDGIGIGAGVVDRLRQLGHDVIEVTSSNTPKNETKYCNLRAEMWCQMRDWLRAGGWIPDDTELRDDLIGPTYGYNAAEKIQLEKKEDMKKRGLASPDCGDALAMTFAYPISKKSWRHQHDTAKIDYDPFIQPGTSRADRALTDYDPLRT
jgi:hypothetical protein